MEKRGVLYLLVIISLFLIILLPFAFATSTTLDSEIKKVTYYAQEYETGNINYVQLLLYSSANRARINELLGAEKTEGGLLKEEQLSAIFGQPTEQTKWVWVEKEEREKKLDKEINIWKKIIFDGNKIQIWLNAWPSIFKNENDREERLIYRLNFEINFKKPKEELDINKKISEIQNYAVEYNKNPSNENAESLAKESVNVEKIFESYMRQNQGICENILGDIFGSENKRETQKIMRQEIDFFEGENFILKMNLEMCDECEWNWVNLDFWIEGRGPKFKEPKMPEANINPEMFKSMSEDEIKTKIKNDLENLKQTLDNNDFNSAMALRAEFQQLNEAWNQKANNIWQEVDLKFKSSRETMTQEQMEEFNRNYGWIKEEQQKKQLEKSLRKENYEKRKEFYLELFTSYPKKEFYFEQAEYEKRLVEEFKEFGEEICNNNKDDNNNNNIDCSDNQCSGKICGKQKVNVQKDNETIEEERDLYCISGECKLKDETIEEKKIICGNNICESGEEQNCSQDCAKCKGYEAIECFGKVIFKGKDENGCSLEPICLNETVSCNVNDECVQPLCGKAECMENKCELIKLDECKEAECIDGEEKILNCEEGNIVNEKCIDGLWRKTNIECQISLAVDETKTDEIIIEEQIIENECNVKEDCGNPDDVCSNGKCITIPKAIQVEEQPIEMQELSLQTSEETITGQITRIVNLFKEKITGFAITGFEVTENTETKTEVQETQQTQEQTSEQNEQPQEVIGESVPVQTAEQKEGQQLDKREEQRTENEVNEREDNERDNRQRDEREQQEREEREREDSERNLKQCEDGCERQCNDMLIMPCVDSCVRKEECKDDDCTNKKIEECEDKCKNENSFDSCINDCSDKCEKGEKFEISQEEREGNKEEKDVFKAGGTCRISQQRTESFIYFDGWGENFDRIRYLKPKYYSGGQAEWCKNDLNNLIKQRKEIEQGLNEEFVKWFFEKYLANSAGEWEQHVSGIYELYWRDVDVSREISNRMSCLDENEFDFTPNLINIKYETEFGKLEFWEEIKTAKVPGVDKEMQIISPYMKIWVFPSKEFIEYEMKKSMKNHEFPGPGEEKAERKNKEGLTEEEKAEIKKDEDIMEKIKELSVKYNGNADIALQFKDYMTNEIVFNLYVQMNENDIIKIEPMLPEEIPEKDITIEIDFDKVYDLIYASEKEMRGEELESPPWDKKPRQGKVNEIYNGVKMYFKVRSLINDAKIYPETEEKAVRGIIKDFFSMMMKKGMEGQPEELEEENSPFENKEALTGEIILKIKDKI